MITERYVWEAETPSGEIITEGADLSGCSRFSLIPKNPLMKRVDIVGVKMERRFCRGFIKALGGGYKNYVHCVVCDGYRVYVSYVDGQTWITPYDYEMRI